MGCHPTPRPHGGATAMMALSGWCSLTSCACSPKYTCVGSSPTRNTASTAYMVSAVFQDAFLISATAKPVIPLEFLRVPTTREQVRYFQEVGRLPSPQVHPYVLHTVPQGNGRERRPAGLRGQCGVGPYQDCKRMVRCDEFSSSISRAQ